MSTKTALKTPPRSSPRGYRFPSPPRRIRKPLKILNGCHPKPINLNKEVFSKEPLNQAITIGDDNDNDAWLHVSLEMLLSSASESS